MSKSLFNMMRIIRFIFDKEVAFKKKFLFLIPILYFLFPFDLMGDFFPLAGQLDDIAVFVLMWPTMKSLITNYNNPSNPKSKKARKNNNKKPIDIDKYR